MEYLFIGLAIGSVVAYFIFTRFNKTKKQQNAQEQSVVLMEKIRSVCKFITVEGDFSEIYHYQNVKDKCSYITYVTGGVGPMTRASLLQNTLKAYR